MVSLLAEKIIPVQTKIATGAAAFIVNKSNSDSLIRMDQVKDILKGGIKNWSQINPSSTALPIEVIFDNPASGIARFLRDFIGTGKALPSNCFAVKNNQAVVEYVSRQPNAIGLIGVEWISDRDDSTANKFLNTVRVVSLATDSVFVKPYQAYVALRQYPLCRDLFIISREARAGLGSGFTAFVAGDKGQRIILKAGLVPSTMPVRIVEINQNEK
jgi:phosphate transport system substrate-binding protein